ncbi:D-alanyl-D-alanine carboxypeptidase [Patescibacteria group bacterium]|nr:D-alanyl-D-alanine carboxypeptidase [Patescibacteria group bacterium]
MILRNVGQLVLVSVMGGLFAPDATLLEWQAGLGSMPVFMSVARARHLPEAADRQAPVPMKIDAESYGVGIGADAAVVIDARSGALLYAKGPEEVRSIGSITKAMTALVYLEAAPDLEEMVVIRNEDILFGGRIYLQTNDALRARDVLAAAMIGSDNSASKALINLSGLSEEDFISRMNTKAKELGMITTTFVDPSGLSANNTSSARDIALLLAEVAKHEDLTSLMTRSEITIRQASGFAATITSTNTLLTTLPDGYEITAGKTGFLPQAGYCFMAAFEHEGNDVYVVVLGSDEIDGRFADAQSLALWTYQTFAWPE